jgi:hypothetical protein
LFEEIAYSFFLLYKDKNIFIELISLKLRT